VCGGGILSAHAHTHSHLDSLIPNPSRTCASDLLVWEIVVRAVSRAAVTLALSHSHSLPPPQGVMLGVALRTSTPLDLTLPSIFWRPLVGSRVTLADVEAIDSQACAFFRT
jgi:hypothetical protein